MPQIDTTGNRSEEPDSADFERRGEPLNRMSSASNGEAVSASWPFSDGYQLRECRSLWW